MSATQQINLSRDPRRRVRKPADSVHIALAAVATLLVLAGLTAHGWWQAVGLEDEVARTEARHDALEARVAELTDEVAAARDDAVDPERAESLRAELDAKQELFDYLEEGPLAERPGFSAHVAGLARRTVDDLWLSQIRLTQGGERIFLRGHTLSPERVPELMSALGAEPAYAGHSFRKLALNRAEEDAEHIDFRIASEPEDDDP